MVMIICVTGVSGGEENQQRPSNREEVLPSTSDNVTATENAFSKVNNDPNIEDSDDELYTPPKKVE